MSIKNAREKKGYNQKQLSELLNVSQPTVSDWECGRKSPTRKNLVALAELLECSIDYLLLGERPARRITDEELKFALFGDAAVDDGSFEEVKRFAEYVKQKRNEKPE